MSRIVFIPTDDAAAAIDFDQAEFTIGRSEDCEFRLDDPSVSRHQARVSLTGAGYEIENLGRNPVEVNDVAVQRQLLADGDQVRFGGTVYRLTIVPDEDETVFRPVSAAADPDRTVFTATWPRLRVVDGSDDERSVDLAEERMVIGRAAESELLLEDPRVSRRHVAIERREDGYHAVLLSGTNTLEVNGEAVREARLFDGDELRVDPFTLRFESSRPQDHRDGDADPSADTPRTPPGDATRMAPRIAEQRPGPRLVLEGGDGKPRVFALDSPRVTIGRGEDCAIRLDGDTVSRVHAAVVQRDGGVAAIALSRTNPVLVNGAAISETRLFRGDTLQVGESLFTFASERSEDQRPVEKEVVVRHRGPPKAAIFAGALLILAMVGFLLNEYLVRPWRMEKDIEQARAMLSREEHEAAMRSLGAVLAGRPPPGLADEARALMADSVLERARAFTSQSRPAEAEDLLVTHLKAYGAGAESGPLWTLLDEVRLARGDGFASRGEYREAIREYLAVRDDSPRYGEAQQALGEVWARVVQQEREDPAERGPSVNELLSQADAYFTRKQYLTPAEANAYSLYRMVLNLEPGNAVALLRISKMKDFYRRNGERFCQAGDTAKAGVYFRRYLLIDPGDVAVRQRAEACAGSPGSAQPPAAGGGDGPPGEQAAARQDRVRQLLDESGVESSWIMQYLFEDGKEEAGASETPW